MSVAPRASGDLAEPPSVVVECPALAVADAQELEARLLAEWQLAGIPQGTLTLQCAEGSLHLEHRLGAELLGHRGAEQGPDVKVQLLRLALELLDESAGNADHPAPAPTSAPERNALALSPQPLDTPPSFDEPGPIPPQTARPVFWAADIGVLAESLGRRTGGAIGATFGLTFAWPSPSIRVRWLANPYYASGLPGGVQARGFALAGLAEFDVSEHLVLGVGPLFSLLDFSAGRGLVTEDSRSTQLAGQFHLSFGAARLESGLFLTAGARAYLAPIVVQIDEERVYEQPHLTGILSGGYRF